MRAPISGLFYLMEHRHISNGTRMTESGRMAVDFQFNNLNFNIEYV